VDSIDGISPAVAIEQKNPTKTSRSTVGTATEVYDYLRLLYARVGRTFCPECDRWVKPDTVTSAVDRVLALPPETRFMVAFPLPRSRSIGHEALVASLRALGFVRLLADGRSVDLGGAGVETPEGAGLDLGEAEELQVVVDRLRVGPGIRDRLADSIGTAFREGEGEALVILPSGGSEADETGTLLFTERFRCPDHPDIEFPDVTPQLFSFNSPYGSCPVCTGFGATLEYDEDLIVPNPRKSIDAGAVDPWEKPRYRKERAALRRYAEARGVSLHAPWLELLPEFREAVIQGTRGGRGRLTDDGFQGVLPFLRSREKKRYKQYIRVFLRRYQSPMECEACGGGRVRPRP
jgi:excinuclease ABC subunit A